MTAAVAKSPVLQQLPSLKPPPMTSVGPATASREKCDASRAPHACARV